MINADTYSEVYEILSYMNKSIVMKIPVEILELIKENRNLNYVSKIDKQDLFNLNNLSKDAINVLAWIDVNYWMNKEKKEKIKLSSKNYFKENKIEKVPSFINKENTKTRMTDTNVILIKYRESIFEKFKNFILKILHINKKS